MSTQIAMQAQPMGLEAGFSTWRRRGLTAFGVWLAALSLWAVLAPIAGDAVGMGSIRVDANRRTVTHRDGGTVAQILVREGQLVAAGQTLVVLDDERVEASADQVRAQLDAELTRQSRLTAEASMSPSWRPDPGRDPDVVSRERGLFEARRAALLGQSETARAQLADTTAEIQAHEANMVTLAEGARLMREELANNEALIPEGFVNMARVLALRRNVADYESRTQTVQADWAKARQRKAELEGRVTTLRQAYVQAAADDLRDTGTRVADLQARLRAATDAKMRQEITAPVAGRLVDLRVNTVGYALGAREPIVDIVPTELPMVVEARLAADAVAGITPGQSAEIHLAGRVHRRLGMLEGTVVNISPDALVEPRSGATYFTVLVAPTPQALALLAREGETIMPGMTVEVFIKTADRSPIQFLLEPLTAGMRRALRNQ